MYSFLLLSFGFIFYYFFRQSELNCNGSLLKINNKYNYRRFLGETNIKNNLDKIVNDLQLISIGCFGDIINYPILYGKDFSNKNIIIIYDALTNEPISTNVSFNWRYKTYNIYHIGLFVILPKYQKKGLQSIMAKIQFYNLLINNFYKTIYLTDIGRSATGFNKIDNLLPVNFPSLIKKNNSKTISLFKDIALEFYNKHAKISAGVSEKSNYIKDLMVIKNSNIKEGGGFYQLLEYLDCKESRNMDYTNYVNKICPNLSDEFIIVGKLNFLNLILYNLSF